MSGSHLSKDFFELVKAIGESKSKQEEDRIILREIAALKAKLADRAALNDSKKQREFLIRLIYVEMLGQDASFGYIKAVELTASSNLLDKRVGYLCAGLCFSPDNEFRIMLVNRLQRDLQSANILEISAALSATCKLLTADMIPAVLPLVLELMKHEQDIIRKKSVMVLHRFYQLEPSSISDQSDLLRRALCDRDPSVMGATLNILLAQMKLDPLPFKDLVPSFISILKQIIEHRLPRDFDYHRIPAPWIQMSLLRILAILGTADMKASESMYDTLLDVLRRADTGISIGYAIVYECVKTVTAIYPNSTLLDAAAGSIARFISSDNHNLKYLGVTGLAGIVKDHPKYAAEHQLAVIDCLEDPDETLKRKTLDLLYQMTNPVNVEVIVDKQLFYLRNASDEFLRGDLVARISQAAEKFAPSNSWYIRTMTTVFELGGDLVKPEVANNLMRLIAEGSGEDDDADQELRTEAVETFLELIAKQNLSNILKQTMFWVLGEYGYMAQSKSLTEITTEVCDTAEALGSDATSRGYAISAALKLTAQLGSLLPCVSALTQKYSDSKNVDLSQRCKEFEALLARPSLMIDVLPVDASCEDIEVDESLPFLNDLVSEALAAGARRYSKPSEDDTDDKALSFKKNDEGPSLKFAHNLAPETLPGNLLQQVDPVITAAAPATSVFAGIETSAAAAPAPLASGLNLAGVKGVWGSGGYSGTTSSVGMSVTVGQPAAPVPGGAEKRPWDYAGGTAPAPAPTPVDTLPGATLSPGGTTIFARPPPEPEKPRELTEKEKMAAALFGGVGATSSASSAGRGRKPTTAGTSTASPASKTGGVAGFGAPSPAPAPARVGDDLDLLGLGSSAPSPAPVSAGGMVDLFGVPAAPVAATSAPATASLPASLALVIGSSPRSPAANQVFSRDANVTLSGYKAFKDDALVVVLFITNTSGSAISSFSVDIDPIPYVTCKFVGEPTVTQTRSGFAVPLIDRNSTASVLVFMSLVAPPANATFNARVTSSPALTAQLPLTPADFLRPAAGVTTAVFGGHWTAPGMAEAVISVPGSSVRTSPEFVARLQDHLHMHAIETIAASSETIFSGRLIGTQQFILIHGQVTPAAIVVRVKSVDINFSRALAAIAQAALK